MKKYLFIAMAAFMIVVASCGKKGNGDGDAATASKYDDKKAGELVDKYNDYEARENITPEDATAIAVIIEGFYDDSANAIGKVTDEASFEKVSKEFEESHKNAEAIHHLYTSLDWDGKIPQEAKNKVDAAENKFNETRQKVFEKMHK